ncbi:MULTISPECIES: type II secretion system protein [unclassified Photobacterium]|uniref:type IV pilus modification PilV family protein n=1 Tax=unclassified Photobacterium TaxID=2628852 RepID=UPI001EE0E35A|nr:type II secretion system protein [Photobacterium sp. Ph6]MCG3874300.1 type II secretion system protein [Photobacterium sp. Ph5]
MNTHIKQRGFTLIEGIITIVLLAIAMITLVSFLFPQVERSAVPHYQARSAAMADAIFNEILARQFDQKSDPYGDSVYRCGENTAQDKENPCTLALRFGPDSLDEATKPEYSNDVDDFIGCWGDSKQCPEPYKYLDGKAYKKPTMTSRRGDLVTLFPSLADGDYTHIFATIDVKEVADKPLKKIILTVNAGRYGKYDYIAYKGNY